MDILDQEGSVLSHNPSLKTLDNVLRKEKKTKTDAAF